MKDNPHVSVIMLSYNHEHFIDEAIQSVVLQSYTAWDMLILDNCSSDASWKKIERWRSRDARIKAIRVPQRSFATHFTEALNMGLDHAKGQYIARADSDDVWLPLRLERQMSVMTENEDIAVCGTHCLLIDEEGVIIGKKDFPVSHEECVRAFWYRNPICHSATLIRKRCFDEIGKYNPEFEFAEDLELWFRFGQRFKLANVPEYLNKYRIYGGNISLNKHRNVIEATLRTRRLAIAKYGYTITISGRIAFGITWCLKWMPATMVRKMFYGFLLKRCFHLWQNKNRSVRREQQIATPVAAPLMTDVKALRQLPSEKIRIQEKASVPSVSLLNVTIPVFNGETFLARSVSRLVEHLDARYGKPYEIVIADNASFDRTNEIAMLLEKQFANVRVQHLNQKGRGRALKKVWSESAADILCYMDVDLATDLEFLLPLIQPLIEQMADVSTGSRLLNPVMTKRGYKREFISRGYNLLVKIFFQTHFSDAQCGFKAITRQAADKLLPLVEDTNWFFDTELLVFAEKLGYQIYDLPVRWTDNPDSRVNLLRTAFDDFKGLMRVRKRLTENTYSAKCGKNAIGTSVNQSSAVPNKKK